MEFSEHETPQKLKGHRFLMATSHQHHTPRTPNGNKLTPKNTANCYRKSINPRTPKGQSVSYSLMTCNSMVSNGGSGGGIHSVSMTVVHTPPAKRFQQIRNPFEAALAERLHLPLIASPSLFQRSDAPQLSSTQWEWTIDEVSSIMPANVEPHETQFSDSPDPDVEAKAQLAISSYFKEQQIVPSPVDCPLRNKRIVLNDDISGHTPLSKPGRRIRDCSSQTELTLPPILPPGLEEALKPYFQPNLAGSYDKEFKKSESSSLDAKDTSLRRKLFDIHNVLIWENEHPGHTNSSPLSFKSTNHTAIVGKLSDSLDKSSFGSLSPISASDDLSPLNGKGSATKRKSRFENLRNELEDLEQFSPIHPPVRRKPPIIVQDKTLYRIENKENLSLYMLSNTTQDEINETFSPERSSSPLAGMNTKSIGEFSSDSFNIKVSRLNVNSSRTSRSKEVLRKIKKNQSGILKDVDLFMSHDETTEDILECFGEDMIEDMQVSQISAHSSNCSSSQSDTPRGKRRSANRKNLSQSFSANWLNDDEEDVETERQGEHKSCSKLEKDAAKKLNFSSPIASKTTSSSYSFGGVVHYDDTPRQDKSPKKSLTFYRTDSGFNELSQNSSVSQECPASNSETLSQIMICCSSTPSTKDNKDKFGFEI